MSKAVIGIDEVGRGALAGPVFVCAVFLSSNFKIKNEKLGKLLDSKKLNLNQRKAWYEYFLSLKIKFQIAKVYPRQIDKINIYKSSNLAAFRALKRLMAKSKINLGVKIFLDGGLYLKSKKYQNLNFKNAQTNIRGDEKYNCIKISSIIAKIKRDEYMKKISKKYPSYFFQKNKGYGTKIHLAMIKKYGPTPIHRLTFI